MEHREFKLHAPFSPTGDQPEAIEKLTEGVLDGIRTQVLVGVTGSGKTFTMANVIKNVGRPTLVIAHNKTLAAQLCNEFREFFPENAVEYFVSYYDYYQPESYIPSTDTYIEKDLSMNDEIDKLRNAATCALGERDDRHRRLLRLLHLRFGRARGVLPPRHLACAPGQEMARDELLRRLVEIHYTPQRRRFQALHLSVCAETSWRSSPPPIPKSPSASSSSATRSTRSARRTSSRARSSLP